ncbi:MAG: LysR family transcriptional regulator [Peptococcaceae bacterium]|nr:LysR family transcriptional regulator [Peptococcaceae bacterium]
MILEQLLLLEDLQRFSSFREAASALEVPESTIRASVHVLEAELGCALLTTGRKGIGLTPAARQMLAHIDKLRSGARSLYRLQDLLHEAFSRPLRLASSCQFGSLLLTEIIAEILQRHAHFQFSLATLNNQALLQELLAQRLDVAFLQLHEVEAPLILNVLKGLPLSLTLLGEDEMVFLLGPAHPLYAAGEATLTEVLACSRLISKDPVDPLTATFFRKHGYTGPIVQISNIISQRTMMAETNYCCWTSLAAATSSRELYGDALRPLRLADARWRCRFYCITSAQPSYEEATLCEQLKEAIGS